jgi:hypothetical protein
MEQQIKSLQEERDKLAGEVWDQQNTINNLRNALSKANSLNRQVRTHRLSSYYHPPKKEQATVRIFYIRFCVCACVCTMIISM